MTYIRNGEYFAETYWILNGRGCMRGGFTGFVGPNESVLALCGLGTPMPMSMPVTDIFMVRP